MRYTLVKTLPQYLVKWDLHPPPLEEENVSLLADEFWSTVIKKNPFREMQFLAYSSAMKRNVNEVHFGQFFTLCVYGMELCRNLYLNVKAPLSLGFLTSV
jgi:hypothetical protein